MKSLKLISIAAVMTTIIGCSTPAPQDTDIQLNKDWRIIPASSTEFSGYIADVPCTVMGALTANGLYEDALTYMNYKNIDKAQFEEPWWFIKEFSHDGFKEGQHAELAFDGISYRADIWLNGTQIATSDEHFGPFRQFTYDVTELLQEKKTLSVKV